jgi:sporulation protein YlmC with PRC-barrel domain
MIQEPLNLGKVKHSVRHLTDFTIETTDGMKGKVRDFLFDEDTWVIRYVEADFGSFFKGNRVLLPANVLDPVWDSKHFSLNISKRQIDNSPKPEDKPTVSREYEKELNKHYGYADYWNPGYTPPGHTDMYYPVRPMHVPSKTINEEEMDTRLRSFDEVTGYHIHATDGTLGHLEDVIIDVDDWQMIYLIVDTSNWRPWSKKVILFINWLEKISYVSKEVSIDVHTDFIKNAPEFDTNKPVERDYEEALLAYYGSVKTEPSDTEKPDGSAKK